MRRIDTMKELHRALGGVDYIASELLTCRSAVGMWTTNGAVAAGHRLTVYFSLQASGYSKASINPQLFDLKSWDRAIIPKLQVRKTKQKLKRAA